MSEESAAGSDAARPRREPSYADAIIPLVALVVSIGGGLSLFGLDALDGPIQAALVVCSMVASIIILKNGHTWEEVAESSQRGMSSIVSAIFILLGVGALIGTWNMAGTIPTLVYYGIQWINPNFYYVSTALICAATSLSIGSSWTTAGTVGVGLVGIASLLGVSPVITAGAVISGAYLGDKTSPLSETTVLASQLAGADLYVHVRAQAWTSVPSFLIAAAVFALLGLHGNGVLPDQAAASADLHQLDRLFWITPLNLIPLAALLVMSLKKSPSSLAIIIASLLAGILGSFTQPDVVRRFVAATVRGMEAAFADPAEAGRILNKYHPQIEPAIGQAETEAVRELAVTPLTRQRGLGYIDPRKMEQTRDVVAEAFGLAKRIPVEELYAPGFAGK